MKDIVIFSGGYQTYERGKKAPGLHLNRFVRDILRECGYPCNHCNESCIEPDICDLLINCGGVGAFACADLNGCSLSDLGTLPTLTEVGGNITGTIDLTTATFTLTSVGLSTYISDTDTPANFGAGEDTVPTINSTLDGLVHESDNKLHTDTLSYADLSFTGIANPLLNSMSMIPATTTVIGTRAISDFDGTVTLNAGTYPGSVLVSIGMTNVGKKYPLTKPEFNLVFMVNGARVITAMVEGDLTKEVYSVPVTAQGDTVTFFGTVSGRV